MNSSTPKRLINMTDPIRNTRSAVNTIEDSKISIPNHNGFSVPVKLRNEVKIIKSGSAGETPALPDIAKWANYLRPVS
jgi:hypothetical protein